MTTTIIEQSGVTALVEVGNNLYLDPVAGGTGPEVKSGGSPVNLSNGEWWGYVPIGAEQTANGGYEMCWKNTADGTYALMTFDSNGNYVSQVLNLAGTSLTLETAELSFQQDLNGDGTIGVAPTIIEQSGVTALVEVGNNLYLDPVAGGTGPELQYQGSPVNLSNGTWNGWVPIGAEQTASGYEVAWKNQANGLYQIMTFDSSGNYVSQVLNLTATSTTLETAEVSFQQDLNGDGVIGIPTVTIESFGVTALVQVGNNYYLNPVAGGTGPELKYQGAPVTVGEWSGWAPIGAEQTASGYEVAWKNSGQYQIWNVDSSGNFVSQVINLTGTSTTLLAAESSFHQDLNGDGVIDYPPTVTITSAAEASTTAIQTITGTVASGGGAVVGQTVTLTDNGTAIGTTTVKADGTFSASVTLDSQGANSIVATVTDSIGLTGSSAGVVDMLLGSNAPTITGTQAGQTTTSETPINPFANVTINDPNVGATDTLTITLSGAGGALSGTGLSGSNGVYTLSGSAAIITAELDALTFTPAAGQPNTSGTTTFTLSDVSTDYTEPTGFTGGWPTVLASFNGTNGYTPTSSLIMDAAGNLLGVTALGLYEIAKTASGYSSTPTLLTQFSYASPDSNLMMDAAGDLFGTTSKGGTYNDGTLYEIAKTASGYSSTPTVLVSFNGADGTLPEIGSLIADAAGNLFGTTVYGGAYGYGTAYEIAKTASGYSSTPTVLVSFTNNGNSFYAAGPSGGLVMDAAGNLFGTTKWGGAYNEGTVFEIAKTAGGYSSTPTILASFNGGNGAVPVPGGLIMDAAGNLFGATTSGGNGGAYGANAGAVFEIVKTASGYSSTPTVLAALPDSVASGLTMDAAGNLFCTTSGQSPSVGDVLEIVKTASGYSSTLKWVGGFGGGTHGGGPVLGGMIMDAAGNLLGAATNGGAYGDGIVFEVPAVSSTPVATVDSTTTVVNTDGPVPPTVTITSAAEASNVAKQTIAGTVTSPDATVTGQTVTLTDNGTFLATTTVQDGTFSVNVTLPNEGTNSIVATVTDSLGLTGSSAPVVDTLDDIAPTVTITSPAEASDNPNQTITGTVVSGGAAAVAGQTVTLTDNGVALGTALVQTGGCFTANVTLPYQGANSIVASVTDSYGNSGVSAPVVDTLDDIAPTVTITSPAEASDNPNQTITGTVVSGGTAGVAGQIVTLTDNGVTLGSASVQPDGSFSVGVTLAYQGANSIVASVTDSYGNTGVSAPVVDTLDDIAPTVTITSPAEASDNPNQTITGTVVSGGAAIVAEQTVTFEDNGVLLMDNGVPVTATVQPDGTFTANVTLPYQGANSLVASVTDSYGNTGTSAPVVDTLIGYASTLTVLTSFNGADGKSPYAGLIMDAAGNLFGTTQGGGANGKGTVFEIAKSGSGYSSTPTTLASFGGANGSNPYDGLFMDAAGNLFGTTQSGGANGKGTVFEIAKSGSGYSSTPTVLASFNGTNGSAPFASLIVDTAGDLFGTTQQGGANGSGTVFEIAKNGSGYNSTPTTLASFNGTTGGLRTDGNLVMDAQGNLFGTTLSGGTNNIGTVFEIAKNGSGYSSTPTVLTSFNGADGSNPYDGLIMDAAGNLFGTTEAGGANSKGTVFEIAKNGSGYNSTPTTLASFNGTDGSGPFGGLITDAAGDLLGTTSAGGANNCGTIFEIFKTGSGYSSTPTVLASLDGTNGSDPFMGSLIMDAAGNLFGTALGGGTNSDGTVFELAVDSGVSQLVQAMASYSANNSGSTSSAYTIPNDTSQQNALAATLHS